MHRSTVNHRRLVQAKAEKVVQLYMTTRQEKRSVKGTQATKPKKKQRAQPQTKTHAQLTHKVPQRPPSQMKAGARRVKSKTKTGAKNKAVVSQPTTHTPVAGPKKHLPPRKHVKHKSVLAMLTKSAKPRINRKLRKARPGLSRTRLSPPPNTTLTGHPAVAPLSLAKVSAASIV